MSTRQRHPHLLCADQTLVMVVDMQAPFLQSIFERERLLRHIALLISGANILKTPILGTTQYAQRMGEIVPEIREKLPAIAVRDKMAFSCYADPQIADEVDKMGRKQILLCGVESHICICQTAHDLLAAGYQVHVVADAISSRTEANWKLGLKKMKQGGALISSVELALYEMMEEAGTPAFREILSLVK